MSTQSPPFRSGFVALVGRPNVGKSTLLNTVIGQKVTIVSDKPQTTRNKIRTVWTTDQAQVIFLDTPGIHRPYDRLGESMVQAAEEALGEVDVVVFVVDAAAGPGPGDRRVAQRLANVKLPLLLVANKIDQLSGDDREAAIDRFKDLGGFSDVWPVSAKTGEGLQAFLDAVVRLMPPGPMYFPEDWVVDHPERFIVAELIREKALELTRDEVPHAVGVEVERIAQRESQDLVDIEATVIVERESQKGIIIGRGGSRLKEIGTLARRDIEALLGSPVNLQLWVKVRKDWREKERVLRALGYQ